MTCRLGWIKSNACQIFNMLRSPNMTKKIIQSIGTTFRYSSLSDNTKVSKPSFYYYVLPSTFKNMKHVLQPPAPVKCSKSSQIEHSENGKYLHDDTKGGSSKIDMDHSQNIHSCTCTPQNVEYPRSLVFTPAYSTPRAGPILCNYKCPYCLVTQIFLAQSILFTPRSVNK